MAEKREATWESKAGERPGLRAVLSRFREYTPDALDTAILAKIAQQIRNAVLDAQGEDAASRMVVAFVEGSQDLLSGGYLSAWIKLIEDLRRGPGQAPELQLAKFFHDLVEVLGTVAHLNRVTQLCEDAAAMRENLLRRYLDLLPSTSLKAAARAAVGTSNERTRRTLVNFVTRSASHRWGDIRELARDPDPDLVLVALETIADIPSEAGGEVVRAAIGHGATEVRKAAVEAAALLPADQLGYALAPALYDADQALRLRAAELFGSTPDKNSLRHLLECVASAEFHTRGPAEQARVYSDLTRTGQPQALDVLGRVLQSRPDGIVEQLIGRLPGRQPDALRTAIIQNVAQLDQPSAQEILKRGCRSPDAAVARLCRRVLDDKVAENPEIR